jgi:uncharacterized protein (TIGR03437 family)
MRVATKSCLILLFYLPCYGQINVLTANYGNDRTNENLSETTLNTSTVGRPTFGKIGTFAVDGQVYAQPLYVSSLQIPGKGVRNVLYVTTMHNSVYALDADAANASVLWQVNLGPSVASTFLGFKDILPEIGVLGTGAIDSTRNVIYVVSDTLENGSATFRLHAVDLTTGKETLGGSVIIAGQVNGWGDGSDNNVLAFDPNQHLQRPALLLLNGAVYVAFGSHADQEAFHGWIFGYDASNLQRQVGVYCTTPNGEGGSIWQSGRGLTADASGNIYAVTGNGDYDGQANFGETFLKLKQSASGLTLVDWGTPNNWQTLADGDFDLGSSGAALVPNTNLVLGGDKFGTLYAVNSNSMGHLWSSAPQNSGVQAFQAVQYGGIFNLAIWDQGSTSVVYVREQGDFLKAYQIVNGTVNTSPISVSTSAADIPLDGMAVSANGAASGSGIVWEITGDHTQSPVPGTLHAFNANDLTKELWNSDMNASRDSLGVFPKFVPPTIANGKVYVPTFSNQVVAYGLLSGAGSSAPQITAVSNSASYLQDSVSPGELVTIYGANFGATDTTTFQLDNSGNISSQLLGAQFTFDGIPAPIVYLGPDQAAVVVPYEVTSAVTQVQATVNGQTSNSFPVPVAAATPALFSADGSGVGQGLIVNQDGSLNTSDNPAAQGSVVVLYATGAGQMNPAVADGSIPSDALSSPVLQSSAQIDSQTARILYAGSAPGIVSGVLQVNVVVPAGTSSGTSVPVYLQIGSAVSQPGVTIAVQ